MKKKLVMIRHAHRDTSDRAADNGLSPKGEAQAGALYRYFRKNFSKAQPLVLSSPRLRCIQTVEAIAKFAGTQVEISPDLAEQASDENDAEFRARIARFLKWWENQGPELTVICSHGDWLPPALECATGARAEFKKAAWALLKLDEGRPVLIWLIQSAKNL